jgi:hypothetical protein
LLRRIAPLDGQPDDEIHGPLAFAQLGDFLAADQGAESCSLSARGDAVGFGAVAVGLDAELRDGRLLVELGILKAGDGFGDGLNLDAERRRVSRSGPKTLTATGADTPLIMWPMRSASGPLTTAKTPGTVLRRLMSARISLPAAAAFAFVVTRSRKSTSNSAVETGTT